MTEQYQQTSINQLPDPSVFQGHLGVNTPIPGALLTSLPITVETVTSPLISHLAGSSDLVFLADGRIVVDWSISIGNANNSRSQSQSRLFIDSGAGFVPINGPTAFGYHRNSATGIGTVAASHQMQVSQGDAIRLASIRSAGGGSLRFLANSCEIRVQLFTDI